MNSNRVVFSAEEAKRFGGLYGNEASFWTPTPDSIQELETLLPEYLKLHPPIDDSPVGSLFDYGRQYYGVDKDGRKLVCLNAFCHPERFDPRWKNCFIDVQDGGSHYFRVHFDPVKKEFVSFRYIGKA